MIMIDIHSHILPGIDDGAKDVKESIELLKEMKEQGITKVVATPHYYPAEQTVEEFIEDRTNAYNTLMSAIKAEDNLPEIVLGAEVYFTSSLGEFDIEKLCIENTDYFILELPYQNFTDHLLRQVINFINSCPKIPIMAHIERYFKFTSPDKIYDLLSYGVLAQMNTSSLLYGEGKRACKKLLKSDLIQVLGTDTHSVDHRPPTMDTGKKFIEKKFGVEEFFRLQKKAELILDNAEIDEVLSI